jgi:acyl-homoserine lactone acylase PvdQ
MHLGINMPIQKLRLSLKLLIFVCLSTTATFAFTFSDHSSSEFQRWRQQARNVTITRDDWGIAHVVGKTDADAVFGAIYAQSEDDFNRIETNYLNSLGRLAEAEGESAIWSDLRQKLFIDPVELKKQYTESPEWLRKLMDAWADGLNYFLATHPNVKPRVITKFEPWMALSFTEGSIGGDIESINLERLRAMYSDTPSVVAQNADDDLFKEPSGSNGIAIAPQNTVGTKALLLINPHTSFYFRSELQVTSGDGLKAYGASTWGQFFIYQGWNDFCGWMHTTSPVDAIDEFRETIIKKGDKYFYKFGYEERPVTVSPITVSYRNPSGMATRTFTVFRTHHGPVVRKDDRGNWVSVALMNTPVKALMQSYGRTKARSLDEFKQVMELKANSSNNTLYADRDGNIAYFHANYVPVRDDRFDWTKPVDGSDPATEYKRLLAFKDAPHLINPSTGWVYNSNNWPWSAAGPASLKQSDYPKWVSFGTETSRGLHAIRVLENRKDFTLEGLNAAAYDRYLTWFDNRLPDLIRAWDTLPANDPLKDRTKDQITVLRSWDQRWSVDSVATSLAVFWGMEINRRHREQFNVAADESWNAIDRKDLVAALASASEKIASDFGTWKTPWGDINRFQRISSEIVHPFSDEAPSIPVGFTSGIWGSLASFGAAPKPGTKKWYGTSGNSFVAVVEFGKTIRAKAVTAGGESGNTRSKHFNDQAARYATGNLREVYFYPDQLKGHTEKTYKPGEH